VGLLIEGAAMGVLGFITYVFARRFEPRIPVVLLSVALGNALTVLLIAFTGGQGYFQPTTLPWVALYTLLTFASALGATTASLLELSRQSD
jgi:ABC-type Co2+ transport system permease subunit